tara:strand:- start:191 stop:622 length:432 start_codon:yes stop_codon:yes gene_type:complete
MGISKKKKNVAKKPGIKKKVVKKTSPSPGKTKKVGATKKTTTGGLKKQYLKSQNICRVTFRLSQKAAPTASKVSVVGEFNSWDSNSNIMKRLKSGDFTITLDLKPGKEYPFRYLTNDSQWINDECADKYEPNPYGGENSVIVL